MNRVERIRAGDTDCAIVIRRGATSDDKYNFLTAPESSLQVGANFYTAGEDIPNHYHLRLDLGRVPIREFLLIESGRARLRLYDEQQRPLTEIVLEGGDMVLLLAGGHGLEILEQTKIVEVKQGPYDPDNDKVLF